MLRRVALVRTTRRDIPEDSILHSDRLENVTSDMAESPSAETAYISLRLLPFSRGPQARLSAWEWARCFTGYLRFRPNWTTRASSQPNTECTDGGRGLTLSSNLKVEVGRVDYQSCFEFRRSQIQIWKRISWVIFLSPICKILGE
jgi:hypothetical protein